jgi:hypothetical protein
MDKKYLKEETSIKEILAPYLKNWKYFIATAVVMLVLLFFT